MITVYDGLQLAHYNDPRWESNYVRDWPQYLIDTYTGNWSFMYNQMHDFSWYPGRYTGRGELVDCDTLIQGRKLGSQKAVEHVSLVGSVCPYRYQPVFCEKDTSGKWRVTGYGSQYLKYGYEDGICKVGPWGGSYAYHEANYTLTRQPNYYHFTCSGTTPFATGWYYCTEPGHFEQEVILYCDYVSSTKEYHIYGQNEIKYSLTNIFGIKSTQIDTGSVDFYVDAVDLDDAQWDIPPKGYNYGQPFRKESKFWTPTKEQVYSLSTNYQAAPDSQRGAFQDACSTVTTISGNTWANLMEVIDLLKDAKQGKLPKISTDVRELWLGYRYAYCTTRSDVEELTAYCSQKCKEAMKTGFHKYYGVYTDHNGWLSRCTVRCFDKSVDTAQGILNSLNEVGLGLNAYNLWDLLPFSFIVDWFLPIGDTLEKWKGASLNETQYKFQSLVFSQKKSFEFPLGASYRGRMTIYRRQVETEPPEGYYYEYDENSSSRTWLKRTADGIAIGSSLLSNLRR